MKILLVNSTCKVGGVSTFMLSLRSALLAQGHECELFFFEHGTMEARLPTDCTAHFGSLADCLTLIDRERFEIVHANNVDWTTGISAVREIGARLVVTAHKAREGAWTYGWTAGNCDAIVAVSRGTAAALQPFTDAPVHMIYNGIDTGRFTPPPDLASVKPDTTPIVAWIGRSASPLKGFDRFAAIAPALHEAGLRIWLIDQHGARQAADAYPAAAAALRPIAERWDSVEFHRMPDLYREIAGSGGCVLSTSVREGLGLALIEAQACGCLAIASDVPGSSECVSPAHGGLRYPLDIDPGWVARLVIASVSDRAQHRARQSATADHVRRQFSVDRMARQYLELYMGLSGRLTLPRRTRVSARRRLSPLLHWRAYATQRLGVGYAQLESSRALAHEGKWKLAAAAGLAALRTSPTMFLKPRRLAHLVRVLRRHVVDDEQRLVVGRHDSGGVSRVEDLR
jgi:glycosyltransferase involved in cell wall biosynthesis